MDALFCAAYFSGQGWFETVHDVLHADWHEAWQDSQTGLSLFQSGITAGTICFKTTLSLFSLATVILLSNTGNAWAEVKYDYMGDGEDGNTIIAFLVVLQV
jgi:hypothetical protein